MSKPLQILFVKYTFKIHFYKYIFSSKNLFHSFKNSTISEIFKMIIPKAANGVNKEGSSTLYEKSKIVRFEFFKHIFRILGQNSKIKPSKSLHLLLNDR